MGGWGGGVPCINDSNFTERNNRQVILISKALLGRIILVIEIRCKINRQTFRGIPGFYSTSGLHGSDLFRPSCRREMRSFHDY